MLLLIAPALADLAPPRQPSPDTVAAAVAQRCGNPYALQALDFTFIVERDGEEKVRRTHHWQPAAEALTVQTGGSTVAMTLIPQMPTTATDPQWASLAPGVAPEEALQAWSAFVNDSYWLLAPCKVMDNGVQRQLSDSHTLQLRFAGVGLTPGDQYTLRLQNSEVVGWSFVLQSGREGDFVWSEHTDVGPLHLSLRRESRDGGTVIRFADVSAE